MAFRRIDSLGLLRKATKHATDLSLKTGVQQKMPRSLAKHDSHGCLSCDSHSKGHLKSEIKLKQQVPRLFSTSSSASDKTVAPTKPSVSKPALSTVDEFLSNILHGNKDWAGMNADLFKQNVDTVLETQKPVSTLLSCCDSRVPITALGDANPNRIFVVRNIGNQIRNSEGSFRFGLEVLKTPYALIMGHTHCGAVRGAASDYRYHHTQVQREILSLVRVIRFCDNLLNGYKIDSLTFDERCNIYSEVNIDYQVNRLVNDWQIRQRVKSGELVIVGLMFDMHNIYGYGHGRILVVNINGDHDELSMKQNSLLKEFRYEGGMPVKRLFSYPSQGANGYVESSMYPQ